MTFCLIFFSLVALCTARVREPLLRRQALLAQPVITAPQFHTSSNSSVLVWVWANTATTLRVFENDTLMSAPSLATVRTDTYARLTSGFTGARCDAGKCSCVPLVDDALTGSTFLVRQLSGLQLSTQYRVEVVVGASVAATLAFRTTSARVYRIGHSSCSDDLAISSAGPTVARFHQLVAPLDAMIFNGDSSYGRGASFSTGTSDYATYEFDFSDVSTDDSRTRDPDWCDVPHQLRRHLFSRDSVMHRAIISSIPVLGSWDDHDLGPNNYFGVSTSPDQPGATSIAAMRAKTSFDRTFASRAFKAFWPTPGYSEWDGANGIENMLSVSPLADLLITDTRYSAEMQGRGLRFESTTVSRISSWCASSAKPVLLLAIASTMTRGSAAIALTATAQYNALVAALSSANCAKKAFVVLSGDVHYAAQHANVFGLPNVFEHTASSLSRHEPDPRTAQCPGATSNSTSRLFTNAYADNFGVVEISLDARDSPVITMTSFDTAGTVIANTRWEPGSRSVQTSLSTAVCAAPTLAGVSFALARAPRVPVRATVTAFGLSDVPNAVTMVPSGAGMRPLFILGDMTCLVGASNASATYARIDQTKFFPTDMSYAGLGHDQHWEAATVTPARTSVEADGAIAGWAMLLFQAGLLTAVDVNTGARLFSTAYFRLPEWPAHWSNVDAATVANLGAATVDSEDENGRLFIFRGDEFIVYNVARCFGRGDHAACKASATTRRFGFEQAAVATLFGRPCPLVRGVRKLRDCFNSTGFPAAQIQANGGVDGVAFGFSNMFASRAGLNISGIGEGFFDFFIGTDVHRVSFTDPEGLGAWSAPRARAAMPEYASCFKAGPSTSTESSSGGVTTSAVVGGTLGQSTDSVVAPTTTVGGGGPATSANPSTNSSGVETTLSVVVDVSSGHALAITAPLFAIVGSIFLAQLEM